MFLNIILNQFEDLIIDFVQISADLIIGGGIG